jgi:hypothetical protein
MRPVASTCHALLLLLPLAAASIVGTLLAGDDRPAGKSGKEEPDIAPPTKDELAEQRMVFIKSALGQYTVQVADRNEPARVSDPCLRWSNPVSGEKDGVLAVFTFNGGRPVAIGQFFRTGTKNWVDEFAIIAGGEAAIMRSDRPFWKPSEYICKFADVPDAPVPAARPPLRLAQMRKIAADFSVTDNFGWEEAQVTKHNLRLLPQPVYRYSEEGKILDGGLFEFELGTYPECNLLLEAYQDETGSRYRYALAPMSIYELEARYKDEVVFTIERRIIFGSNCRKYYALTYRPAPGETVPD